jgi:plastocyanin
VRVRQFDSGVALISERDLNPAWRPRVWLPMRKLLVVSLLTGLVAALLTAAPALSKEKSVEVDDNYFVHKGKPSTVTVKVGTKVEWEWEGSGPHNVTVTKGPVKFHSKIKSSGKYVKTLRKAGTYKIICTIHAPKMRMTLKVTK